MTEITLRTTDRISDIGQEAWDRCAGTIAGERALDPFTSYRFLEALERSGSVGVGTGWQPLYLEASSGGEIIGVAPAYVKSHSQGEYIFDHAFAQAYTRAGGRYYPKLQFAVPFTPVTGPRLLSQSEIGKAALLDGAKQIVAANDLSSLHVTFCTQDEVRLGKAQELLPRVTQQYHWKNDGYDNFDDFLSALSSRKRKNIRKERATAQGFGGEIEHLTGEQIEPHHWDAIWAFYQDTGARKWGTPYLTRAFFEIAQETLRDDILLIMAKREGRYVAGAMNMIGRDALFGRYWGCLEYHPAMHFEICYYQAIDAAIAMGLGSVEAGAQGEHKLARGYLPTQTHSLHWMVDQGFNNAVADYLTAERRATEEDIEILTQYGPFKKHHQEEVE